MHETVLSLYLLYMTWCQINNLLTSHSKSDPYLIFSCTLTLGENNPQGKDGFSHSGGMWKRVQVFSAVFWSFNVKMPTVLKNKTNSCHSSICTDLFSFSHKNRSRFFFLCFFRAAWNSCFLVSHLFIRKISWSYRKYGTWWLIKKACCWRSARWMS